MACGQHAVILHTLTNTTAAIRNVLSDRVNTTCVVAVTSRTTKFCMIPSLCARDPSLTTTHLASALLATSLAGYLSAVQNTQVEVSSLRTAYRARTLFARAATPSARPALAWMFPVGLASDVAEASSSVVAPHPARSPGGVWATVVSEVPEPVEVQPEEARTGA